MTPKNVRKHWLVVLLAGLTPLAACNFLQIGNPPDDEDDGGSANLAVFADPDSDFTTSDVRDVDEEIVRFDTTTNSIIWAEDETSYQAGAWTVNGVFLAGGGFQVRFGTKDGERRAYFTETGPATICQIEAAGGFISISATNVTVPQE